MNIVLTCDYPVPNVRISGSWTDNKFTFNFGAESVGDVTTPC